MRSEVYSQLDPRWSALPYPYKPYNLGTSGCGCCSVTHVIIELDKYKKYTPKDVQPFMKQFAVAGQGTQWDGIKKGLEHYGFKVINHATMTDLFKTLGAREIRLGVILFCGPKDKKGNRLPATKGGITWTTSGHYVAFTDYKVKNGKHYFYIKDSGGRQHTGWYCYETQMAGLIPQVWSALPPEQKKTVTTKPVKKATKKLTTAEKFLKKMTAICAYMKEKKFVYKGSYKDNALTWEGAKKKKSTNCSLTVSYALQERGLLQPGQYFWLNGNHIKYIGKGTKAQLHKVAKITHPHKPPKKAGLKVGDIVGYKNNAHTMVFAGWSKNGYPLWDSTGGNADIKKGKPHRKKSYDDKTIDTIVRLK